MFAIRYSIAINHKLHLLKSKTPKLFTHLYSQPTGFFNADDDSPEMFAIRFENAFFLIAE